ncbi:hypothetical protein GS3922_04570 [Geobacillus subterraneus]|uniref:Major facilitator superfamily (MFS) profile domain-containing protein n=1 Tax=Geobacillus subterraneus TaxID=129338 RepID=A0ABM6A9S3_9BACL|nr:hypothetical protein GS3922_04570 [Geobacillus subterraneus]
MSVGHRQQIGSLMVRTDTFGTKGSVNSSCEWLTVQRTRTSYLKPPPLSEAQAVGSSCGRFRWHMLTAAFLVMALLQLVYNYDKLYLMFRTLESAGWAGRPLRSDAPGCMAV